MQFKKLKSTSLNSIAYNEKGKSMQVIFKNNAIYQYEDISKGQYEQILNADSPGNKLKEVVSGKTYSKL